MSPVTQLTIAVTSTKDVPDHAVAGKAKAAVMHQAQEAATDYDVAEEEELEQAPSPSPSQLDEPPTSVSKKTGPAITSRSASVIGSREKSN